MEEVAKLDLDNQVPTLTKSTRQTGALRKGPASADLRIPVPKYYRKTSHHERWRRQKKFAGGARTKVPREVPENIKDKVTDTCVKMCAVDLRLFNVVNGHGF